VTKTFGKIVTVLVVASTALSVTDVAVGSASTSSPNADQLLATALTFAARQTSLTLSGTLIASGLTLRFTESFSSVGSDGAEVIAGIGTEDEAQTTYGHPAFVKASSLAVLSDLLQVKKPTVSEIGQWYEIPKTDKRYSGFVQAGGAQTISQAFSISQRGFAAKATYEGTTTLKGVKVIKLLTKSNMWANGSALIAQTLYITNTAKSRPYATSGPSSSSGVLYFSHWGNSSVTIPTAVGALPA
jgi:hypothetical protein